MEKRRSDRHSHFLIQQLVNDGLLNQQQALKAVKQAQADEIPIVFYMVQNGLLEPRAAASAVSRCFEMPVYDISVHDPGVVVREFLHFDFVKKHYGLPIFKRGDHLVIAITEPNIPELRNIGFLTCMNVEFIIVEVDKLKAAIENALHADSSDTEQNSNKLIDELSGEIGKEFDDFQVSSVEDGDDSAELLTVDDINDTPVVRFVNKILIDAIKTKSSDIHFEPYEKICRVRYRQDGLLNEIVDSPKKLANSIVARLKVLANLDISEHRVPQDGRFRLTVSKGHAIDIRISTCPTVHGEKVVMRILDPKNNSYDLSMLGMDDLQKERFLHAISQSQGMILVTGPTGSGKTVTLYTALHILNTIEKNISTVEDPVEIYVHGINQVHVNPKAGMTFAGALRSFLRQDPDIIMVGEIRDLETAEIGIKAAQTGHLVLSTLHTNSAPLTLARLISMGVPAFNIASAVHLVMAQRLVRKLCPHCKRPVKNTKEALLKAGVLEEHLTDIEIFEAVGCARCVQGYKGRVAIYEVMPISEAMTQIIMANANAMELAAQAHEEGVLTLREAGFEKVRTGITSLEELDRVTIY